jgi:CBS domain-containing protein
VLNSSKSGALAPALKIELGYSPREILERFLLAPFLGFDLVFKCPKITLRTSTRYLKALTYRNTARFRINFTRLANECILIPMEAASYDLPVTQIMVTDVPTISPDVTVKDAAVKMEKTDSGSLIVVDGVTALGIVTEKDIVQKVAAEGFDSAKVLVEDIMTSPLITIPSTSTVRQVSEAMRTFKVRKIVVMDEKEQIVGLVTSVELAKWCSAQNNYSDPALNALAQMKPGEGPYE